MSEIAQMGELELRIMVFSKAFQDLLTEILKLKQENESYKKQISDIRKELSSLRSEVEQEKEVELKKERIKRKYKESKDNLEKTSKSPQV